MKKFTAFIAFLGSCLFLSSVAFAALPPSATLSYTVDAEYKGLSLSGKSVMQWKKTGNRYEASKSANTSMLGNVLTSKSTGTVRKGIPQPSVYTEKKLKKGTETTKFNTAAKTITYPGDKTLPAAPGVADRLSAVWQVIALASSGNASKWTVPMAGHRSVDIWTFTKNGTETITTPYGQISAVKITGASQKNKRIVLWLSPKHNWYPVKLQWDDKNLSLTESLESIVPAK